MALVTLQYRSEALMKNTLVHLVVPSCDEVHAPLCTYKTLYMLHGLSEDAGSWIRKTNAERYATERDLILVMPSADRSMYCDGVLGQNYFTHVTQELPVYLEWLFGISRKREKNYIMGFSMGGYGAARAALIYPDRYAAWGSFSGPLDLEPMLSTLDDEARLSFPFLLRCADEVDRTPMNPVNLLDSETQKELKGYIVCGTDDDLLFCSKRFQERSERLSLDNRFIYPNGLRHDWAYVDKELPAFFDFVLGV